MFRAELNNERLEFAKKLATSAGNLAQELRLAGATISATKSSDTDIVTQADKKVEEFIRSEIKAAFPEDNFWGEETGLVDANKTAKTWIVDPIDGTVNYFYNIPYYAVSIAVVAGSEYELSEIELGVVYAPALKELFWASKGAGAFLNGEKLPKIDPAHTLGKSLVATGFSYQQDLRATHGKLVAQIMPKVRDIRRLGAASLDLAYVAAGRVDLYFERGLQVWDFAAGVLLISEVGGAVSSLTKTGSYTDWLFTGRENIVQELVTLALSYDKR